MLHQRLVEYVSQPTIHPMRQETNYGHRLQLRSRRYPPYASTSHSVVTLPTQPERALLARPRPGLGRQRQRLAPGQGRPPQTSLGAWCFLLRRPSGLAHRRRGVELEAVAMVVAGCRRRRRRRSGSARRWVLYCLRASSLSSSGEGDATARTPIKLSNRARVKVRVRVTAKAKDRAHKA
jgi:hypothetical protein